MFLSVCLLVTRLHFALVCKMAEQLEVLFGMKTLGAQGTLC